MYEKLARGHATACINELQGHEQLMDWIEGPRRTRVMLAFERSSMAKKPGRVIKRLAPLLRPHFRKLQIIDWTRDFKMITARAMSGTTENLIYRLPDDTSPLYSERAVFMTGIMLTQCEDRIGAGFMTESSISHHAISRLVQREGIKTDTLSRDIFYILEYCSGFAERSLKSKINHDVMTSFMLPFERGALVAVFMDMNPVQMRENQENRRILSVRTWLDEDKLTDLHLERMDGLNGLTAAMAQGDEEADHRFLRWIENNARPWQFSDMTMKD